MTNPSINLSQLKIYGSSLYPSFADFMDKQEIYPYDYNDIRRVNVVSSDVALINSSILPGTLAVYPDVTEADGYIVTAKLTGD